MKIMLNHKNDTYTKFLTSPNNFNALDLHIMDSQRSLLEVQKDILSCLEKMSKGPDTSGAENLPEIKLGAESKREDI